MIKYWPLSIFVLILLLGACTPKVGTILEDTTSRNATTSNQFSPTQSEIIGHPDADNLPLRVWKITNKQDSLLLRQKAEPVIPNPNDPVLNTMISRLLATVQDSMSLGVGIAAPQVGILKNIIWVQRFDKPDLPFEVYLNPVIKQYTTKKQPCMEGCLSIPDKQAVTKSRAYAILLEYDKPDGTHVTEMIEDFTAVVFQHEIDHLHGILFLDHLEAEIEEK